MPVNKFYVVTSMAILLFLGYLSYQILHPFFNAIAWAGVFTIVFYPLYKVILSSIKSKFIASLLTVILILLIIVGPFISLSFVLIEELRDVAEKIDKDLIDSIENVFASPPVARIISKVQSYLGVKGLAVGDVIAGNLKKFGQGILDNISLWAANITRAIIDFIFMAFAVFFLLKDGPDFLKKIKDYLPFSEKQKDRLALQIKDMTVSTVYGGVVVAIVQGLLGGIAFFALDIKAPVLWGTAMSIMSFLPMLGTFSIWGPVSGYLIIQGSYMKGMGLLLFGALVIGIVDNILRPIIISGRTKMPTLLIFFSVLGGMEFMGFIGFIMGPLVLALFLSVFEIFRSIEGGTNA
ncbi:MAG: AI-2E family transporter [Nitrospirae bacterium]|nr:AI-2E family transporter [Nitrospirota bacterium]